MSEKVFQFEDGSVAKFIIENGSLTFYIQARHFGKEIKTTSTTVNLTPEETLELLVWAGDTMAQETNNE